MTIIQLLNLALHLRFNTLIPFPTAQKKMRIKKSITLHLFFPSSSFYLTMNFRILISQNLAENGIFQRPSPVC